MTATELINNLLQARPVGDGRWMARCPAHNDRSPSLSIRTGRDGRRVLLRCWAGCRTECVLEKLGLNWKDICGEPITDAQAREAMADRRKRRTRVQLQRSADRAACDRIRRLDAVADELVSRLVRTPDHDPACHAMARLLDETLNQLRRIDMEVAR